VAGVSTSRNTASKEINFFRLGQLIAAERPFALHTHPDKTRYSHVKIMPSIANDSRATSITSPSINASSDHCDSVAFPVLMKLGCNGVFDGAIRSLFGNVGVRFWSAHEIALRAMKTTHGSRDGKRYKEKSVEEQ